MRKGFTLVELSIVLVIIGLLISGILVAQSMISTAKIAKQVSQISEFDASVMNFKSLHKYLPGDAPAFAGDGDGVIETGSAYGADDVTKAFGCEIGRFWAQAMRDQFSPTNCASPFQARVLEGSSKNVPVAKIGRLNTFFIASAISTDGDVADKTLMENYYAFMHSSQASALYGGSYQFTPTTLLNDNYPVTPAEAVSLDTKMDNGVSNTGIVISGLIANNTGTGGIIKGGSATCDTGGVYVTSTTTPRCVPLIRIGGVAGDPQ